MNVSSAYETGGRGPSHRTEAIGDNNSDGESGNWFQSEAGE
ncbi:hypothetical protein [Haloarcula vallismortis]|nr:hypothetical protein [Haloarcula vallismortis]